MSSSARMRLLLGLLLPLATSGCEDDIGYVDPVAASNYAAFERTYRHGKPHGTWHYYYSNGALWRELDFSDGLKHGADRTYYPKGQLQLEGTWQSDLRHGTWRAYSEAGGSCAESIMTEGTGTFRWCYGNGQLAEDSAQVRGILHGATLSYFSDGSLSSSLTYDMGVLHGPFIESDGDVRLSGAFQRGLLDGVVTGTYENSGDLAFRGNYSLGVPTGEHQAWYEGGQVQERVTYDDQGVRQGEHERYYESGQLELRERYRDGVLDGPTTSFYQDGKPYVLGTYEAGLQTGLWEFYREDGQPDSFVEFEAGQWVGVNVDYDADGMDAIRHFDWKSAAHDEVEAHGLSLLFNGGDLTQLCRFERGQSVGCQDLGASREGTEPQRLIGIWQLVAQNGSPSQSSEQLEVRADGTGKVATPILDLPFSYRTKGPLMLRSVGVASELDVFFVDGSSLYLFRRENFWQYRLVN